MMTRMPITVPALCTSFGTKPMIFRPAADMKPLNAPANFTTNVWVENTMISLRVPSLN